MRLRRCLLTAWVWVGCAGRRLILKRAKWRWQVAPIAGTWSAFFQTRQRYRCGQVATHSAVVHSVTITVDGKTIPDAAHVPLNNATDGPGPDKSAHATFALLS